MLPQLPDVSFALDYAPFLPPFCCGKKKEKCCKKYKKGKRCKNCPKKGKE